MNCKKNRLFITYDPSELLIVREGQSIMMVKLSTVRFDAEGEWEHRISLPQAEWVCHSKLASEASLLQLS